MAWQHSLGVLTAAGLLLQGTASAQGRIEVKAEAGALIPHARIELWGRDGLFLVGQTGASGTYDVSRDNAAVTVFIVVKAIGYSPTRVPQLQTAGRTTSVEMRPTAVSLAPLAVHRGDDCSFRDARDARRKWNDARRGYLAIDALDGLALVSRSRIQFRQDTAPVLEVDEALTGWGERGSSYLAWSEWLRQLQDRGFATVARTVDLGGNPSLPLVGEIAMVFGDPLFGSAHKFTFADPGGDALRFCPRSQKQGGLTGVIQFDSEGGIRSVVWAVRDQTMNSPIGGFVLLAPPTSPMGPLLPIAGANWAQTFPGRVRTMHIAFSRWRLIPADSLGEQSTPQIENATQGSRHP